MLGILFCVFDGFFFFFLMEDVHPFLVWKDLFLNMVASFEVFCGTDCYTLTPYALLYSLYFRSYSDLIGDFMYWSLFENFWDARGACCVYKDILMHRILSFFYTTVRCQGLSEVEYLVLCILNNDKVPFLFFFFFLYEEIIISILKYLKNLQVHTLI